MVPPRDVVALANAIHNVLSLPPGELRAVGAEGRERAIDHFSASVFADKVAKVLRSAPRSG